MKMVWRSIVICMFLLHAFPAFSQSIGDQEETSKMGYVRYLGIGAGAVKRSFIDEALSDRKYERIAGTASLANIRINETKYTELWMQASYLSASNKHAGPFNASDIKTLSGLIDYRHTYKIDVLNENVYDVRVGGILSGQFCHKNAEELGYTGKITDYAVSLGVTGKISREVYFNNDLPGNIMLDVSIPFVAASGRPRYLNPYTKLESEKNSDNGLLANNTISMFKKFARLNARIHVIYPLKRTTNRLRFTYQWDYYKIKGATAVFSAEHTLMVTFMFSY